MHGHAHYSFTTPKMPLDLALSSTALLWKHGPHSPPNTRSHLTLLWSPLSMIFNTVFADGNDFSTHISNLHTKWVTANNAGTKITGADFRMIILSLLPASWDSVIGTKYEAKLSAYVISHLLIHWNCTDRSKSVINPATVMTALQTDAKHSCKQLQCANKNCGCWGHTIANCYWHGGGKEGQFPPGFGQHGGVHTQSTTSATNPKGALAIECQTGTRLVSPRRGPKKKFGSLNN